jgi:hypothetical protein
MRPEALTAQTGFQNIVGNRLDAELPGIEIDIEDATVEPIHGVVSFLSISRGMLP